MHTGFFNAKQAKRKDAKEVGEAKWQWGSAVRTVIQ